MMINQGNCARYHNRAVLDFDSAGQPGISVFHAQPYALPHSLDLMERHPKGSQAFIPMYAAPFLVIVAEDNDGQPARPKAFLTQMQQGINIHRGVWHGVLSPLNKAASFAVVDWIGEANNLEEHHFETPWQILDSNSLLNQNRLN